MPYWLEDDAFPNWPVWDVLSAGNVDMADRLQSAYVRCKSTTAGVLADGYLTEQAALTQCRGRPKVLALLATAVLDRPPLLHRRGDECECLGDGVWIDGYAYRVHAFSKRNPSRKEYNRNRAQKADLRDSRLKALVYGRDGGCCRFCHSGPLNPKSGRAKDARKRLQYDHVDPDAPAGPEGRNLVVACGRCNESKGHRTPDEADMVLLPPPTPEEAAAWHARGPVVLDPPPASAIPAAPADHRPISDQSTTNHEHEQKPTSDRDDEPITGPDSDANDDHTPPLHPTPAPTSDGPMREQRPEGSGLGRGGPPRSSAPPPPPAAAWTGQPVRSQEYPDIYHRRSRGPARPTAPPPADHPAIPDPGPPDYRWPAGSVPTRPPGEEPTGG
ncbi:hypothetical protein [Solwaraspora sp. WMMD792]|uniref:HNH endonuclease n=2 Tax=Solwaraspora sp. WMMD792 TaxID=3016099 RepID=UPI0024164613|nr:hypothetical protein [Solwaraspora sp. WMMD792]MDG4768760.1 hypothetical protein [Solwaraspora sp. WMMD792]MDG4768799.1 hypothetical protein [Solwaraspora sp. WMMD792]MDG4768839.1 hypothetical protein [Solwaraspora sp. WMMD792]MDG4768845.1 hypothetical protein [Solwaraspora sp. WMMD792]MDG4768906.1 hypothetical protein [Solwaraspora sp. WMMD792]